MAYKQHNNTDDSSGSMSEFNAHDPKFEAKYMDEYLEHEYLNGEVTLATARATPATPMTRT